MNNEYVLRQFNQLKEKYPNLEYFEEEKNTKISGEIVFLAEYNNVPITDSYFITIIIPEKYPDSLPSVFEINSKIPKRFEHFLTDGSLCLGVQTEIKEKMRKNPTLLYFVDSFVISYLYSFSYYTKYKQMPYGERAHGLDGVFEFYKEKLAVKTKTDVIEMLGFVCFKDYRGHLECPCGSKMKTRNCIHKDIIMEMKHNDFMNEYLSDLYYMVQQESKNKNYTSRKSVLSARGND